MRPIFPKKSSPQRFLVVWPPLRPASALLIFFVSGIRPPPPRSGCPGCSCVNHLKWPQGGTRMLRGMPQLSPAQRGALGPLLNAAPFPKVVRDLGRRFEANGHELYLVGGAVRDALLDRRSPDIDLTTHPTP